MPKIGGILDHVARVAEEFKLANLQPQIDSCRQHLYGGAKIDVGRFKAGKSSFLNHLSGRAVLPVGVVPLTAVITRLRYGPVERAEVRFVDRAVQTIPLDDICLYVGENGNPNNARQVSSVEVELPALQPLGPLAFVDTPGLGSALIHNTEVAVKWLPNVGAALLAMSSDAPLSAADVAFLDDLRGHTPRIALLLTKADLLTEPERVEALDFVLEQIRRKWGGELPVFFYSIKAELGPLRSALVGGFLSPLRQSCGDASGQILRHKLASLQKQTLNYLRVALAAATQAESARQALRERLDDERWQFGLFRMELEVLTRRWSAGALEQSLVRLQPVQRALQGKMTHDLQAQFSRWRLRVPALLGSWREWVQSFLARELGVVSHAQQAIFCEPVQRASAHLTRSVRAFHDRLAQQVNAALGVSLPPCEFNFDMREPSAPPLEVSYAFEVAFSRLSYVMPAALFRRPVERMLLRKARYEVEKNLSRLAADWNRRVAAVIQELRQQTEQIAQNELAWVEEMLKQTTSGVPRLQEHIGALEALLIG